VLHSLPLSLPDLPPLVIPHIPSRRLSVAPPNRPLPCGPKQAEIAGSNPGVRSRIAGSKRGAWSRSRGRSMAHPSVSPRGLDRPLWNRGFRGLAPWRIRRLDGRPFGPVRPRFRAPADRRPLGRHALGPLPAGPRPPAAKLANLLANRQPSGGFPLCLVFAWCPARSRLSLRRMATVSWLDNLGGRCMIWKRSICLPAHLTTHDTCTVRVRKRRSSLWLPRTMTEGTVGGAFRSGQHLQG